MKLKKLFKEIKLIWLRQTKSKIYAGEFYSLDSRLEITLWFNEDNWFLKTYQCPNNQRFSWMAQGELEVDTQQTTPRNVSKFPTTTGKTFLFILTIME